MSKNPQPIPTEIQLHRQSRVLEITFDDGQTFNLPCHYLRVFSTSAEVQAGKERGEIITGKENVNITKIEPVGQYAINLHFDDGHNTGIFSWETLYDLGKNYDQNWQDYLQKLSAKGLGPKPAICPRPMSPPPADDTAPKNLTLLYFESYSNLFAKQRENVILSASIKTVKDLLAWLRQRGGSWATALEDDNVTVAINKLVVELDSTVTSGDEIALAPKTPQQ